MKGGKWVCLRKGYHKTACFIIIFSMKPFGGYLPLANRHGKLKPLGALCHVVTILTSSTPWYDMYVTHICSVQNMLCIYYIYICVCVYVYIYICICVCIYIYICVGGKNRYNLPCVCFKGLFIYIWMDIFSCSCVHLSCRFNPVHTSQITPVQNMFAFYLFNITPTHLKQKKTNADECGGKKVLQKW